MTGTGRRAAAGAIAGAALVAMVGCGAPSAGPATPSPSESYVSWDDSIDTSRPSEDPAGTVYGYVQAMATGDRARACTFQYRGSSDYRDDPCVHDREQPARDGRWPEARWRRLAAYDLADYSAHEDRRGWVVSVPTDPVTRWRIRQDDAGIWFIR